MTVASIVTGITGSNASNYMCSNYLHYHTSVWYQCGRYFGQCWTFTDV